MNRFSLSLSNTSKQSLIRDFVSGHDLTIAVTHAVLCFRFTCRMRQRESPTPKGVIQWVSRADSVTEENTKMLLRGDTLNHIPKHTRSSFRQQTIQFILSFLRSKFVGIPSPHEWNIQVIKP